ncbi:4-O-methyl-glucuronoyl methylesterase 1-like [Patiria miniata]|uniref:Uncharacterized protein n=1 Tax=Patiria miniata TaxID=46514 RepID=A0A913ZVY3_PATMI|nr:4-O-methyl-glucuronoyl methylesterase 1-like [Patiria miniata]
MKELTSMVEGTAAPPPPPPSPLPQTSPPKTSPPPQQTAPPSTRTSPPPPPQTVPPPPAPRTASATPVVAAQPPPVSTSPSFPALSNTLSPLYTGGIPVITERAKRLAFNKGKCKESLLYSLLVGVFGEERLARGNACGSRQAVNRKDTEE